MSRRAPKRSAARGARNRIQARREGPHLAWAIALLLVCLVVAGGIAYVKFTAKEQPKLMADTLCPVDGAKSVTEVLIDASDDIHPVAKKQILGALHDLAGSLPPYGRLELRTLSPDRPGGLVVFDKCNPGDGSNLDALVANPEMAKRRWNDGFAKPLEAALSSQLGPSKSDSSPLMETIQNISVERFLGNAASAVPKRLVIVSDMIEHESDYSQYRGDLSYARFKSSSAYRRLRTDLNQAEVTILYIQRLSSSIDTGKHIEFWKEWVSDNGGILTSAEKLQGAG